MIALDAWQAHTLVTECAIQVALVTAFETTIQRIFISIIALFLLCDYFISTHGFAFVIKSIQIVTPVGFTFFRFLAIFGWRYQNPWRTKFAPPHVAYEAFQLTWEFAFITPIMRYIISIVALLQASFYSITAFRNTLFVFLIPTICATQANTLLAI